MSHAFLAPSSAPHWRWCAGSVVMSAGIGDEDTDASRDGEAAHWVCEQVLKSMTDTDLSILIESDLVSSPAPNGTIVDEKMYDAAIVYTRDILRVCTLRGLSRKLHIEEPVTMPQIHEQCWGTPDCWAFDEGEMVLYLWDFKYGHSGVVAFENWQMICYALGILNVITNGNPLNDIEGCAPITVKIRITQPRCYDGQGPFRDWEIKATDLRGYINQLAQAAEVAVTGLGQCVTGSWCKNCDGAALCPAIGAATATVIDHSTDIIPTIPTEDGLAYELRLVNHATNLLKQRKDSLEEMAKHRLHSVPPVRVPGWTLEQGYGDRAWVHPEAEVISMGELMGVDLVAPAKLLTPAKADALLKKNNVDASVITSYYARKPTAMKLVVDDGSKAIQIFSRRSI